MPAVQSADDSGDSRLGFGGRRETRMGKQVGPQNGQKLKVDFQAPGAAQ